MEVLGKLQLPNVSSFDEIKVQKNNYFLLITNWLQPISDFRFQLKNTAKVTLAIWLQ